MTSSSFKTQYQEDNGLWSDVRDGTGQVRLFSSEAEAHAGLATQFPEATHLAKYGGEKRTRVVRVYRTDEEWEEGTPPEGS